MKKILIIAIGILTTIGIYAQPPGGSGGRGPGGPPPGGRMSNQSSSLQERLILEHFPEIPDLTLEQREKVGIVLSKEHKDIEKQLKKKHELKKDFTPETSEKALNKLKEKTEKIDKKIQDIRNKSNEKIRKDLSEEQYSVFLEKRENFKFGRHRQRQNTPPPQNTDNDRDYHLSFPPED